MPKPFQKCNYPDEPCDRRATHKGMCQMHRKRWVRDHGTEELPGHDAAIDLTSGAHHHGIDSVLVWNEAVRHFRRLGDKLKPAHVLNLASAAVDLGRPEYLLDLAAAAKVLYESLVGPSEARTSETHNARQP